MRGYRAETYGERIAEVYDERFTGVSDVDATVRFLDETAGRRPARILELAVGTGRLAVPLTALGHDVTGVDVSPAMLDRLRANDPSRRVTVVEADMVDGLGDLPGVPFDLVYVAYSSLFLLTEAERQAACFATVAAVLSADGAFVVEAFVPIDPPRSGSRVAVRSMTAQRLVLDASVTDPVAQTVDGQFVELTDGEPVRLRPFRLRWSYPAELDSWAAATGLGVAERHADVDRSPFDDDSSFHVTVYRRATPSGVPPSA